MTEELQHTIPSIPAQAGIQGYKYQASLRTPAQIVWKAKRQAGAIGAK